MNKKNKEKNDPVLNEFKAFMEIVFHNCRINYYKKLSLNNTINIEQVEYLTYNQIFNENEIYDLKILSKKEQVLLNQLYNQGLSYKEISEITSEKYETLKKRRNRAIKKLKERLKYYGE